MFIDIPINAALAPRTLRSAASHDPTRLTAGMPDQEIDIALEKEGTRRAPESITSCPSLRVVDEQ